MTNALVRRLFWIRKHIDIARGETGWFTQMAVDIAAIGLILNYLGYLPEKKVVLMMLPLALFCLWLFGYLWSRFGFYKTMVETDANINPVQGEIYSAARKINNCKELK